MLGVHRVIFCIYLVANGLTGINFVTGHGRMMEPPNRSSIWRFPEFEDLEPPRNDDDDGLWCGGYTVQHDQNGGKCGECGDNYNDNIPRANEDGGTFGRGILVRNYTVGQVIPIDVFLTKSHRGYFEFRICGRNSSMERETESCFDENRLEIADGSGYKLPIAYPSGYYNTTVRLPPNLKCSRCVLQWHYRTGNNWGDCGDGTFDVGCGPQETFRGCSDISIS